MSSMNEVNTQTIIQKSQALNTSITKHRLYGVPVVEQVIPVWI